jgi:hypothetical protein
MVKGTRLLKLAVGATLLTALFSPLNAATQTLEILGGHGNQGDESKYTEFTQDGGNTWEKAYLTGAHPWGFAEGTNSWINFDPSPFVGLNTTVDYRVRFFVPSDFKDPKMNFLIKADNEAWIGINGINVGHVVGSSSGAAGDATLASALHPGMNEINIKLKDYGGWVGLNYRIDLEMESNQSLELQPAGEPEINIPVDNDKDGLLSDVDPDDNNPDIDGDGIPDGVEVQNNTNPLEWDTDGDGVSDNIDINPRSTDSDGDGILDGEDNEYRFVSGNFIINGIESPWSDSVDEFGVTMRTKIEKCDSDSKNHGQMVRCLVKLVKSNDSIDKQERGDIIKMFSKMKNKWSDNHKDMFKNKKSKFLKEKAKRDAKKSKYNSKRDTLKKTKGDIKNYKDRMKERRDNYKSKTKTKRGELIKKPHFSNEKWLEITAIDIIPEIVEVEVPVLTPMVTETADTNEDIIEDTTGLPILEKDYEEVGAESADVEGEEDIEE